MYKLTNNELANIQGGAVKLGVAALVVGVGVFIIGVVDGLLRPLKCYKK